MSFEFIDLFIKCFFLLLRIEQVPKGIVWYRKKLRGMILSTEKDHLLSKIMIFKRAFKVEEKIETKKQNESIFIRRSVRLDFCSNT